MIRRLLALPTAAKLRLIRVSRSGGVLHDCRDGHTYHYPDGPGRFEGWIELLADDRAWEPYCAVAWMWAATPYGGAWERTGGVYRVLHLPESDGATGYVVAEHADPRECALLALEAIYGAR